MDKVLVQMENDYASQEKWQNYAENNDKSTFLLLFEKDFPQVAAERYEQNDQFFKKLFEKFNTQLSEQELGKRNTPSN